MIEAFALLVGKSYIIDSRVVGKVNVISTEEMDIIEAEKMPKAKKLLVLKVDTGIDKRTIVSGIAEHFKPEDIIGKKVSVVANLKPIKLRGTLSEGMILMTENADGKLVFVNPDENGVTSGTAIS